MSKYTFTFKKDDIFAEFSTTDREVVEKQFQIWVADADNYAKNKAKKTIKPEVAAEPKAKEEEKKEKPAESMPPLVQEQPVKETPIIEQPSEVLDKASTPVRTINTIQEEITQETTEAHKVEEKPVEAANFEDVLEKSIENPTFEPNKSKDQIFLNLINSKNTTDKFHYLIITAYYLSEFEKMERFSLKQINSKLMQNLSEVIDHVTLQEAINQNFIELVPDLTGVSEVGEYRLTPVGEDFFANKI